MKKASGKSQRPDSKVAATPDTVNVAPENAQPVRVKRYLRSWFGVIALGITLFSTALHLPSLRGALVTDDVVLVSDFDRRGCGPDPLDCFNNLIGHFYYRPMLSASFAFGQKFHNNDPIWFHAEIFIFHFLAIWVAFFAFKMLFRRRSTALIAGAILALHPFNVTVTSWIGGRTDTMALGFMALYALGAMKAGRLIRLRHRLRNSSPGVASGTVFWILVSCVALLASIFTKEQSMGLVFLAPLLASGLHPVGTVIKKIKFPIWTAVYLVPVIIFAYVAHNVLKTLNFDHADWSIAQHIEMVGRTLSYYASEFFAPTVNDQHVSTLGPWHQQELLRAAVGFAAATAWCVLLVKTWKCRRMRLCMLWASLCIGTVINVIPIPNALAAPFRTAVAMFGVSGMLAMLLTPEVEQQWLTVRAGSRLPALRNLLIAGLLGWYLVVTVTDVPNWLSEASYTHAQVVADPNFVCARAFYASEELRRGHKEVALAHYDECMWMLFGKETQPEQYVDMLRAPSMLTVMQSTSTLRYRPLQYIPQVIRERGRTLQLLHRYDDASRNLRAALIVTPDDAGARQALVECYRALGKNDKADLVQHMDDVLKGSPL